MSWLEAGGVCCVRCTVVSFPRGRISLPTANKTGRINWETFYLVCDYSTSKNHGTRCSVCSLHELYVRSLYEVINSSVQTWLILRAKTRRAVSSSILARWFCMMHRTVANIISFIYAQNATKTGRYSSSYGPAKLDDAMASFEVKTRRAITSSILVRWCQLFH